jgi:hypothetical protein
LTPHFESLTQPFSHLALAVPDLAAANPATAKIIDRAQQIVISLFMHPLLVYLLQSTKARTKLTAKKY